MRRFAGYCTTESHPLYAIFLTSLSRCLFEWDPEDVALLLKAKKAEMQKKGADMADDNIRKLLSREELARHCRRRTRGVEQTTVLLEELVEVFESDRGRDIMGVPLFPPGALRRVWEQQRHHVACIQDPPNIGLYYKALSPVNKGGIPLPLYKCSRGSTSLEGFHNHLARFIPGNLLS